MIDSGVCPWCQTIQAFTCYGRQQCQICGKPIFVTRDRDSCSDGLRTTNTNHEHELRTTSTIIQDHADYWKSIVNELLTMEAELEVLGLEPRKMIAEVTRRIERLTSSAAKQTSHPSPTRPGNQASHKADEQN